MKRKLAVTRLSCRVSKLSLSGLSHTTTKFQTRSLIDLIWRVADALIRVWQRELSSINKDHADASTCLRSEPISERHRKRQA